VNPRTRESLRKLRKRRPAAAQRIELERNAAARRERRAGLIADPEAYWARLAAHIESWEPVEDSPAAMPAPFP
jgi:hypothetical protein